MSTEDVKPSPPSRPVLVLEGYENLRLIGKGRFSEVYFAKKGDSFCALKKFSKACMETPELKRRVEDEIKLLQSLDHPNIVKHFGMIRGPEGDVFIELEWADGGDLKQTLKRHRAKAAYFSESRVWNFFVQIVRGVHYMHDHRVLHRDLKPANILVMKDCTIKVADLGLSRKVSELVQELHSRVGTPLYMAPEVLKDQGYFFSSDVWSMGCILYELMTLSSPFRNYDEKDDGDENGGAILALVERVSSATYPPVPEKLPYSYPLRALMKNMLVPEPSQRIDCSKVLETAENFNKQYVASLSPASANVKSIGASITASAAIAATLSSSSSFSFTTSTTQPVAQRPSSPRSATLNPRLSSLSDQPGEIVTVSTTHPPDSARLRPPALSIPGEAPVSVMSPHSARVIIGSCPESARLRRRGVSQELRAGSDGTNSGNNTPSPTTMLTGVQTLHPSSRPRVIVPPVGTTSSVQSPSGVFLHSVGSGGHPTVVTTPSGRVLVPHSPRLNRLVSSGTYQPSPLSPKTGVLIGSPKSARLPPKAGVASPHEILSRKSHHRRTISATADYSPSSSSSKSPVPSEEGGPASPVITTVTRTSSVSSDEDEKKAKNEGARSRAALFRLSVNTDKETLLKNSPEIGYLRKTPATAAVLQHNQSNSSVGSDFRKSRWVVASSYSESSMSPVAADSNGINRQLGATKRPLTPTGASSSSLRISLKAPAATRSTNPFSSRRRSGTSSPRSGNDLSILRPSSPFDNKASRTSSSSLRLAAVASSSSSGNPFASTSSSVTTPKSGRLASFGVEPMPSIFESATSPVTGTPTPSGMGTTATVGASFSRTAPHFGLAPFPMIAQVPQVVHAGSPQSASSTSAYKFEIWTKASNKRAQSSAGLAQNPPLSTMSQLNNSSSSPQPMIRNDGSDHLLFAPSLSQATRNRRSSSPASGMMTSGVMLHQGSSLQTRTSFERDDQVEYLLGEVIGEGSFAKVYRAVDPRTGQSVAVKQMHIEDYDSEAASQMEKEISFLSTLSHPNLVKYLGTSRFNNRLNIILEYCTEGSISSMLRVYKRFPEQLIRLYTRQMVDALVYLHGRDIVHRDIKGGNVLVHGDGTKGVIKLSDFGCSKLLQSKGDTEKSTKMKGTVLWMAPEAAKQSTNIGTPSDIWSLGATVIEMATGKPPWMEEKLHNEVLALIKVATTETPPRFPQEVLSSSGISFLHSCMQLNPDKRLSAKQLALHEFLVVEKQVHVSTAEVGKRPQIVGASSYHAHLAAAKGRDMQQAKDQVVQRNIESAIDKLMNKLVSLPDHSPEEDWSDIFTRDVEVTVPSVPVRLRGLPLFFVSGASSGTVKTDGLESFRLRLFQETPKESDGPSYRFKAVHISKSPFIQIPSRTAMWKWEITGTVFSSDNPLVGLPARASGSAGAELDLNGHKFKTVEFEWNPVSLIENLKLTRTSPSSSVESASSAVVTTPRGTSSVTMTFSTAPLEAIEEERPSSPVANPTVCMDANDEPTKDLEEVDSSPSD